LFYDIDHRTRQCNNPVPQGGGADCVGSCFELGNCLALTPCTNEGGESIDFAENSLIDRNEIASSGKYTTGLEGRACN